MSAPGEPVYPRVYQLPDRDKPSLVVPPAGGWRESIAYLVEVSWKATNPVHRAILHVGFLNTKYPQDDGRHFGGYCEVWCNSYDEALHAGRAFYLRAVQELGKVKNP